MFTANTPVSGALLTWLVYIVDALSLDEYEELQRAARERQEIVAKYDLVNIYHLLR